MADCDHEAVRVTGNADPFPDSRNSQGVYERLKFDALCEDCDSSLWVVYDLTEVREP